jgi:hypothetical protein
MPERIFIIEFLNADAARRWYRSDEYQAVLKIRLSASHGRVFLIEGTEISAALPVAGLDAGAGRTLTGLWSGASNELGQAKSSRPLMSVALQLSAHRAAWKELGERRFVQDAPIGL